MDFAQPQARSEPYWTQCDHGFPCCDNMENGTLVNSWQQRSCDAAPFEFVWGQSGNGVPSDHVASHSHGSSSFGLSGMAAPCGHSHAEMDSSYRSSLNDTSGTLSATEQQHPLPLFHTSTGSCRFGQSNFPRFVSSKLASYNESRIHFHKKEICIFPEDVQICGLQQENKTKEYEIMI